MTSRRAAAALAATGALFVALPAAGQAQPTPTPASVLDGPTPALAGNTGLDLSIARDGTGGLAYLKQVGGVQHVFASSLVGGSFGSPQQLDGGLGPASSPPVVAAGNGGLVIVAFVNGGELYAVTRGTSASPWSAPIGLAGGASNPAIQMTNFGKAYIAFTAADGAGHDVRAAYYYNGAWALERSALNNIPADDAGTGSGRPAVAAAGDGVAIVAWGEGGHVFTRRVWGTSPSVVLEQADAPPAGCGETSAGEPSVGSGGDSSFAAVAFHETLNCGGQQQSRVLMNRLHGSVYDGIAQPDGLSSPAGDGADEPGTAVGEYGRGWVTSVRTAAHDIDGMLLNSNESPGQVVQVNGEPNAGDPHALPAIAGLFSNLIAWQHDPGGGASPDVRMRYASDGGTALGPEQVLSSAAQGATDAGSGFTAAGDVAGDVAVAWMQDTGGLPQVVVAQLYQPPASFAAVSAFRYVRSAHPVLAWSPPSGSWGPMTYTVTVSGSTVGRTNATSLPVTLQDGQYSWQVTATNPAGLRSAMPPARVFVDTVAPKASFKVTGHRTAGAPLRIAVKYSDGRRGRASGVATVTVYWGDGTPHTRIARMKTHVYKRAGRFKIRVVVRDRAGNTTTLTRFVKIAPKASGQSPSKRG